MNTIFEILSVILVILLLYKYEMKKLELKSAEFYQEKSREFNQIMVDLVLKVGYIKGDILTDGKIFLRDLEYWEYTFRDDGKVVLLDKFGCAINVFEIHVD